MSECPCGLDAIGDKAIVLNALHVVEYFDPDSGEIFKQDLSRGPDGLEIDSDKIFVLAGWANMRAMLPEIIEAVRDYDAFEDGDEDEDGVPAEL